MEKIKEVETFRISQSEMDQVLSIAENLDMEAYCLHELSKATYLLLNYRRIEVRGKKARFIKIVEEFTEKDKKYTVELVDNYEDIVYIIDEFEDEEY